MGYYIARMLDDIMVRKYIDRSNYIDIAPQDFEAFKSQAEVVAQMLHEQEAKYEALKREHYKQNLYSWAA